MGILGGRAARGRWTHDGAGIVGGWAARGRWRRGDEEEVEAGRRGGGGELEGEFVGRWRSWEREGDWVDEQKRSEERRVGKECSW